MSNAKVTLVSMQPSDRDSFIRDNQEAFRVGAMQTLGPNEPPMPEGEENFEIISKETIEATMDAAGAETYRVFCEGEIAGGAIINIDAENKRGRLDLFFVCPRMHSKGVGYAAWQAIEALHPEIEVWETSTPHFEVRNLHFYINKCGFHAVEFYNRRHPDPHAPAEMREGGEEDLMFRFEKHIESSPSK